MAGAAHAGGSANDRREARPLAPGTTGTPARATAMVGLGRGRKRVLGGGPGRGCRAQREGLPISGASGPKLHLAGPVTGIAAMPNGQGYWLVSADGGVYAFGSAKFYGSVESAHVKHVGGPVVGIAAARDGRGYWLVSSGGDVYSFGDAKFFGPSASLRPRIGFGPIVGIVSTPSGRGYWLASSSGGVFSFGNASYHGSATGSGRVIIGMAPTPDGKGYWLAARHGAVVGFGDAPARGSAQGKNSAGPIRRYRIRASWAWLLVRQFKRFNLRFRGGGYHTGS